MAEKFLDSARKTAMLTYKITLPDSPHPLVKIPDFGHFISLE